MEFNFDSAVHAELSSRCGVVQARRFGGSASDEVYLASFPFLNGN